MHYAIQEIDEIRSMNSMVVENGTMWVLARNTHAYFTASSVDYDRIAPWHWRVYEKRILTTMPSPTYGENAVGLAHYLTQRGVAEKLTFKDKNWLNVSRENISGVHKRNSPSIITVHGAFATLHLNNETNVKIDAKHVPLIDKFTWHATFQRLETRTNPIIRASSETRISLHRLILGLDINDGGIKVVHKNGNRLDCRESNLVTYKGRQPYNLNGGE